MEGERVGFRGDVECVVVLGAPRPDSAGSSVAPETKDMDFVVAKRGWKLSAGARQQSVVGGGRPAHRRVAIINWMSQLLLARIGANEIIRTLTGRGFQSE